MRERTDPLDELLQIDAICDAFESAWNPNAPPNVADYVAGNNMASVHELLTELVIVDAEYRKRHGLPLPVDELLQDFPDHRTVILQAISTATSHANGSTEVEPSRLIANVPARIGRFQICDVLGRGACATVFRALDPQNQRDVAIKLPHAHLLHSRTAKARFCREAHCASRLSHAGIVPILEVGREGSTLFLVAEYVPGPTLEGFLQKNREPIPIEDAVRFMLRIADALEFAHSHGVIHRDLKPSNILIERNEKTSGNGYVALDDAVPRIVDFGLARQLGSMTRFTGDCDVLGTLAYMSPEQAKGNSHDADVRSDIYSLGVIMHELLTTRHPYPGTPMETLAWLLSDQFVAVDSASVPNSLKAICEKCLEKNLSRRYQSVGQLKSDLGSWLNGNSTVRRGSISLRRASRWFLERKSLGISLLVLVAALVVTAVVAIRSGQRIDATTKRLHSERVQNLISVSSSQLRQQLALVREHRPAVDSELVAARDDPGLSPTERCRFWLALLPVDETAASIMYRDLEECDVRFLRMAFEYLGEVQPISEGVMSVETREDLLDANAQIADKKRLARICIAAQLAPTDPTWQLVAQHAAQQVIASSRTDIEHAVHLLQPIGSWLLPHLMTESKAALSEDARHNATRAIIGLTADPRDLASLVADADDEQFRLVASALTKMGRAAYAPLERELARRIGFPQPTECSIDDARAVSNVACMLLLLGAPQPVWPLLDASTPPEISYRIIFDAPRRGVLPETFVRQLLIERQSEILHGIILTMGGYGPEHFDPAVYPELWDWLHHNYMHHPASGVHSAIAWLLKSFGDDAWLMHSDSKLIGRGLTPDREWYVNSIGQCMVVIRGPLEFEMGSAENLRGNEPLHRRLIRRDFAIATTLLTWDQLEACDAHLRREWSQDGPPGVPVNGVRFGDAMLICDWLSRREGIPTDQWVYAGAQSDPRGKAPELMGYRMPTEAEWEYACRAGTSGRMFVGKSVDLLVDYAWLHENSGRKIHRVGLLKPNRFGLFDIYGNLLEWCQDVYSPYSTTGITVDSASYILSLESRVVRGAHYLQDASAVTSSHRIRMLPDGIDAIGLRTARTIVFAAMSQ